MNSENETTARAPLIIKMHPDDGGLSAGTVFPDGLTLRERLPQGHKVALVDSAAGAPVQCALGAFDLSSGVFDIWTILVLALIGYGFVTNPISGTFLLLALASLPWHLVGVLRSKKGGAADLLRA